MSAELVSSSSMASVGEGVPNGRHEGAHSEGGATTAARSSFFDIELLRDYLEQLLPVVLGASRTELTKTLFSVSRTGADWRRDAARFADEAGVSVAYIDKVSMPTIDDDGEGSSEAPPAFSYRLQLQPSYSPTLVASIALLKRVPTLDSTVAMASQLHMMSLSGPAAIAGARVGNELENGGREEPAAATTLQLRETPYEALHSVVHNVMSPWFDAYISSKQRQDAGAAVSATGKEADARMGVPMTKKKFAELELSLLHLQQNIEIPEVYLSVHPIVQAAVEHALSKQRRPTPDDIEPTSLLHETGFLNALHKDVNRWVREIQAVTKLDRDVPSGTAGQEVNFWPAMEKSLELIEAQLKSPPVALTLDILRVAKRYHATVSFLSDTGIKDSIEKVHDYNIFLKDFPLNDLLSATDLDKAHDAITAIFNHMTRRIRSASTYPVKRLVSLTELLSRDLTDTLTRILGNNRIMHLEFPRFCELVDATNAIFQSWDEGLKDFVQIARDVIRKRGERAVSMKIDVAHVQLKDRLRYIYGFRKTHEQLRAMVSSGKGLALAGSRVGSDKRDMGAGQSLAGLEMNDEVIAAYEAIQPLDVLDVSAEGTQVWTTAEVAYNERVARVENTLIARLRDLLGQARSAREMLRVLSQFNSLFVRPKVRGAVQEYQQQLLQSVKADISALHDKFKAQYRPSEANYMSQLRDFPEIAGAIVWARQIERQLDIYMSRVEDVLGRGWELYAEGQKLQSEGETFRRKLDTRPLFDAWLKDIASRQLSIAGRVLSVNHSRAAEKYSLAVSFDGQAIVLFKEVRNLLWLRFTVPRAVVNLAAEAKRVYPHAVSLNETVRTYTQSCALVEANPGIAMLLAQVQNDVQKLVSQGTMLRWENFSNTYDSVRASAHLTGLGGFDGRENRQAVFVRQFALSVSSFQDKATELISMQTEIRQIIEELSVCVYDAAAFKVRLDKVQGTIDRLNLEGYPNLEVWVDALNHSIEEMLIGRLHSVITAWCTEFALGPSVGDPGGDSRRDKKSSSGSAFRDTTSISDRRSTVNGRDPKLKLGGIVFLEQNALAQPEVSIQALTHEIRIQNQVLYLSPPLEYARASWFTQLQALLDVVCGLRRVQSSRYEIGLQMQRSGSEEAPKTYSEVLTRFDHGLLVRPISLIEAKIAEVGQYVAQWLQFQSLWDLEAEQVFARLGDDLVRWQQLLSEIRKTRVTFDNYETQRSFGAAIIDYEQVQSKVNAKYDAWQRDILNKFGTLLSQSMREIHASIFKARGDLETQSIETSSTAQTVTFITLVQDLTRKAKKWGPQIDAFRTGQKVLERQRYAFAQDWLYSDQVDGEWSAFNETLRRRNDSIQEQLTGLQMKIMAEDKIVRDKIAVLTAEWEEQKPIQGSLKADAATNVLNIFDSRVVKLVEDRDLVARAKESLDLEHLADYRLDPVIEELRDLKAVWTALSGTWNQLGELRELAWATVQPRKIRQQLDALLAQTKSMPSRMRQYAAFEFIQETLRSMLKSNVLVVDLKSEAMRERHWRSLYKQLKLTGHYTPSSMTLGSVWDLDLRKNETIIKSVILNAQGELALEEYLKQVRETWTAYTLDLINYQNKCRLIRGWDALFQTAGDHLNALRAMSMSPHYKVFEEEAILWEDRLSKISVLFDTWIDVQRQWVYLEGIFSGSAEIRHILPVESSRFQNINTEFLAMMKKVYKSPFVLDVLAIPSLQKSLERLADLLGKIQKALGEYLERERAQFPRFYFVGDEDLLEIIGNSKDVVRIMKHLKKMFAGIATVRLDADSTQIEGMTSREGEDVAFTAPIVFKDYSKINEWLSRLELEMRLSLATLLSTAVDDLASFYSATQDLPADQFLRWIDRYPAQLVVLAVQIVWTSMVHVALDGGFGLEQPLGTVLRGLDLLADTVLTDIAALKRRKSEHLITELVHQRDVIRRLITYDVRDTKDFAWLYQMRFYLDASVADPLARLSVHMANARFPYGYEYLGVPDRLVQTPLTDRCYLTLTQALNLRLGGAPFGPAGTGKTESVKALGLQLGMFVLVFCCDETFDFQAMGRIFMGLCRVGAWGCFDEFNRLEERILSAVSQQIQSIQHGLAATVTSSAAEIELVGKAVQINPRTGIFITTNPTYAGRSNLPDNLKKLFRNVAMTQPDRELIAQVMLFSQGFRTAEVLAQKIVPFFNLCSEQLSPQPHYDFGLRALKSVLVSAGQLKRDRLLSAPDSTDTALGVAEQEILIQSVWETIVPKLVADDVPLLTSLLSDVFPGTTYKPSILADLRQHISAVCRERRLEEGQRWLDKVIQLYQIQKISHGLMVVGPSGAGKSHAWQVLLTALERLEGIEGVSYVINPKAMSKDALYGTLDQTTREWNDGLFTHILRKIVDNVRGESNKRHWIIFDGDVDPEWVENLNSVLDDNKLLTLPNGERLNLPPNVRIIFEVEHLRYATLATVSRCGMIWFSDDTIGAQMMFRNFLDTLKTVRLGSDEDDSSPLPSRRIAQTIVDSGPDDSPEMRVQATVAAVLEPFFADGGLVLAALDYAGSVFHIMDFTLARALTTLFSLINKSVRNILEYNSQHSDFPVSTEQIELYSTRRLIIHLVWALVGDSKLDVRSAMGEYIASQSTLELPPLGPDVSLIDYDVALGSGDWFSWQSRVPTVEIDTSEVLSADVVIPTMDTIRHEEVLYSWLSEHKPLMLCGPPGSGKTMTLFSALRKLPDMEVVGLNFSSATTPELILKTFEQYCEHRKSPNGVVLAPTQIGSWLVVFCDEINLPAEDKYGTQRVISFLRQLVESGGYWRPSDKAWVRLERIQFVGACNPPTDPGRVPLSHRFLRHAPLVMVDYPGSISLNQIYGTFNRAMLKLTPNLRGYSEALTAAMVGFYLAYQRRFTPDIQAHYVVSPRELTRFVRGIFEIIRPLDSLTLEGLVRVWAHEAQRIFQDRLVSEEEKRWTEETVDETASHHFPSVKVDEALVRPILYSNWLSKHTASVSRDSLREYVSARMKLFAEEELDTNLVLFDGLLDIACSVDRILRQRQGHVLMLGLSGSGRTTLSRFIAWLNGLSIFQIATSNKYGLAEFDEDLRELLRRVGCQGEKVSFIIDESQVKDPAQLERMNTLLANSEVPGLFEGDQLSALLTACKDGSQREGLMLDSSEELLKWFSSEISKNLHVTFTMNPPSNGLSSRAAASPALFNRCTLLYCW